MSDDRSARHRVLLTVSGRIPAGIEAAVAAGERPRVDYLELARALGADLLGRPDPASRARVGRLLVRAVGENVAMAWACWRRRARYDVIVTDGEQIGLPFAALLALRRRAVRHVMIVHIMSVPKKARLFKALRLGRGVDGYVVYASAQRRFLVQQLGVPTAHVLLRPFMVDSNYFHAPPAPVVASGRPTICTAGLEFRDYPTLMLAVTGLDADVVVGAASPWSKRANELEEVAVPDNVTVAKFTLAELRDLYARSTMAVMPLYPSDFQAGITTILESMSMGRAVVCTLTDGQTDTIADGVTGIYVPAGDPVALRTAIERVLGDEELRSRLGGAARAWVVDHAELDRYVEQLVDVIDSYRPVRR